MVPIPGYCEKCGVLFTTDRLVGGSGSLRNIKIKNVGIQPCPVCGERDGARVLDGTYDFVEGVLTVLQAPEWSLEKLKQMAVRLEAAKRSGTPTQALEAVARDEPQLEHLVKTALRNGWKALCVIAILATIVSFVQDEAKQLESGPSVEQKVSRVHERIPSVDAPRLPPPRPTLALPAPAPPKKPPPKTSRRKKPAKTHGKQKRRRRKR
jgi:hypothetical protein